MTSPSTTSALANATIASETSHVGNTGASTATRTKASVPMITERAGMVLNLPRLHPRKQALRPEHQHQRHHRIDDEQFDLRRQMHGGGPAQAYDQRADKGAADRPHAAD